ncbi:MAG: glycosyltransferase [Coriobacteriia bacterium]|nr:glycosyltransferase [Coriobacteriia bacterium]
MGRNALIVNSLDRGGAERQALCLFEGLREQGVQTVLISTRGETGFLADSAAEGVYVLGKRSRWQLPLLVGRLRRVLRKDDVLVCYNWYQHLLAALAMPGNRRIVVYGNVPSRDGVIGVKRFLGRVLHSTADAVIGCSRGVTRQAVREMGSPRLVCAAVPNAVYRSRACEKYRVSPWRRPYVISAGRLAPEKDFELLIGAFASIADDVEQDLIIAGAGPLKEQLNSMVEELRLTGRVHLVGFRRDLKRWLRHADLFALSSRWEGFGNVIVEAMSVGTPVVVTDAPFGPREILERIPAGRLVRVGGRRELASAIREMLDDGDERHRLGRLALDAVPAQFSVERVAAAYLEILRCVSAETETAS